MVFFQWKLANRKFPFKRSTSKHVQLQNTWLSRSRSESIALFSTKDEPAKPSHFFHTCAWQQKAMVSVQLGWVPTLCWGSRCKQGKHSVQRVYPVIPLISPCSIFQYLPHQGMHSLLSSAFHVYIGARGTEAEATQHRHLAEGLDRSSATARVWWMKCGG